jgi:hypothetical protein
MKTAFDCIPCIANQAHKVAKLVALPADKHEALLRDALHFLSEVSFDIPAPVLSEKVWKMATHYAGNTDPLLSVRQFYNKEMMKLFPKWWKTIQANQPENLTLAMKLAIAGNIIDFGTPHNFDIQSVRHKIDNILHTEIAVDNSDILFSKLEKADQLLYLGDNCGEIVFDKLFIQKIRQEYPNLHITFVTRGKPVLNDIIRSDAFEVGINEVAEIIDNGDGAPSTVLERVSQTLLDKMEQADVIISKGQGNFEGLDQAPFANLFFLFMVKCPYIASLTKAPLGGLLCRQNLVHNKIPQY